MLEAAGLPIARVNTVAEGLAEQQVRDRDMVVELDHATAGKVKVTGIPTKFSKSKTKIEHAPPVLGQHTREVLQQVLGWSPKQVDDAKDAGWV